jgi:hypothetical protein
MFLRVPVREDEGGRLDAAIGANASVQQSNTDGFGRHRITVNSAGVLTATVVTCP